MDPKKLNELKEKFIQKINTAKTDLLIKFPIQSYIEYINEYPTCQKYGDISSKVEGYCSDIINYSNKKTMAIYHKLLLVNLLLDAEVKINNNKKLTPYIKNLYFKNFTRIISNMESDQDVDNYLYPNDKFHKILSICSLRLLPLGAQKINIQGFSRQFLFKKGIGQLIKGIFYILFDLKGSTPLYEMHTDSNDPDLMSKFNEKGWIDFYKRVADLLILNPQIKGIFGSSWFFDPQLGEISPRLDYLRKIVIKNGGKLFFIGTEKSSIQLAILKSKTRKNLYQEGKYVPTNYMVIWSREKLIKWAQTIDYYYD